MQDSYASGHSMHVRVTQTLRLNNKKNSISCEIEYKGSINYLYGQYPTMRGIRLLTVSDGSLTPVNSAELESAYPRNDE